MSYSILNKNDYDVYHFAVDRASSLSSLPSCALGSMATVTGSGSVWKYNGSKWQFQGGDILSGYADGGSVGISAAEFTYTYREGMTWDDWVASEWGRGYCYTNYWYGQSNNGEGYVYYTSQFALFPAVIKWSSFTECCFAPGSQILLSDYTTKSIEDVQVGDEVISYNLHTQQFEVRKCIGTIIHQDSTDVVDITLTDGTVLTMRAYHPLLTTTGWKSLREYDGLPLLTEEDEIITYAGLQRITQVVSKPDLEGSITYNLNIEGHEDNLEGCDNYVVNGVVAHNASCPT